MIPSSGCPPWPPDHPRTLPRTGTPTPPRGARPTLGNDGKMRVTVPVEALEVEEATEGADVAPTDGEAVPVLALASPLHMGDVVPDVGSILSGQIRRLEAELEALREERDAVRSERD